MNGAAALTVLAGGTADEADRDELHALYLAARHRIEIAAHALGQPAGTAVHPRPVPAQNASGARRWPRRRPDRPSGGDAGAAGPARPAAPMPHPPRRRPRAGTGPAAGGVA